MSCRPSIPTTRPSSTSCGHQMRRNTFRIDSAIAMRMPGSTPSNATPSSAMIDSMNSVRRWCQSRREPLTSTSEIAAAMTMAASVG